MKLYIFDEGTMEWIGENERFYIAFDDELPYWGYVNKQGVMESDYFTEDQTKYLIEKLGEFI